MCRLWGVTYLAWFVFAIAKEIWPFLEELTCYLCLVSGLCKSEAGRVTWVLPCLPWSSIQAWMTSIFQVATVLWPSAFAPSTSSQNNGAQAFVKGWNREGYQYTDTQIQSETLLSIFLVKDLYVEMLINMEIKLIHEYIDSSYSIYIICFRMRLNTLEL